MLVCPAVLARDSISSGGLDGILAQIAYKSLILFFACLTHYYMARNGYPHIYMATYFTTEPDTLNLCRFIVRTYDDGVTDDTKVLKLKPNASGSYNFGETPKVKIDMKEVYSRCHRRARRAT